MIAYGFFLAGALLGYNAFAQSKLECRAAAELFFTSISINQSLGKTTFEVLNTSCTDVVTEGKSARALLDIDAKLVRTDWDLPQPLGPPNTGSDLKGSFAPLGTKFRINVETTYTLWDSGWKPDSFKYKDSRRMQ